MTNQWIKIMAGASLVAGIAAIAGGRSPKWLRIALVSAAAILAVGAGTYAYRYLTRPTTLSVAVGSIDGDGPKIMSAIAGRLASANSPVRLKVVDKETVAGAARAFAAGDVDLAIVRADAGNLSAARTLVLIAYGVVLIATPSDSKIKSIDDLKGKTIGVVGGEINRPIVDILTREYDLARAKVQFKDLRLPELAQAIQSKQVSALLVVIPTTEKYLAILRSVFVGKQKLELIPIESAAAMEAVSKIYESYDLPKGTVKGSPAIPDDDLTTIRVPIYLVAGRKIDDDLAGVVTKAVMETRRDLIGEYPLLAQIGAPNTEKDAPIPVHPGAAAYFDGDQKTIFEKYGDQFFYGSMLLGTLMSLLAAAWKFMTSDADRPEQRPLNRLYALAGQIRKARNENELAAVEESIDEIVRVELERYAGGTSEAGDAAALSLATHRLEYLVHRRRAVFDGDAELSRPAAALKATP